MGDHHHGDLFLRQADHHVQHLLDGLGIQGGGGLVKEDDLGLGAQGPGNGDALLLPAGEGGGVDVGLVPQAHHVQVVPGQRLGFGAALVVELHGGQGQVPQHGHVGVEVELLEHHGHVVPHHFGLVAGGQLQTVDVHMPAAGLLQEVHAAHRGGLARAGGPDDDQLLALSYLQVNILEHVQFAKVFVDLFQSDHVRTLLPASAVYAKMHSGVRGSAAVNSVVQPS